MSTILMSNNVTVNNSVEEMQKQMRIKRFRKEASLPITDNPDKYRKDFEATVIVERDIENVDALRSQANAIARVFGENPKDFIASLKTRALEAAGFNCSLQELPEMRSFYVMQLTEDPNPAEVQKVISDIDFVLSL